MEKNKQIINIAIHKPTGAKVPVLVNRTDEKNLITDYSEYTKKRKGFTVTMLQNRWRKSFEDVLEILKKYEVPAYINQQQIKCLSSNELPVTKAIFFEEYIYGIEKKSSLPHCKLKSRYIELITE